MSSAGDDAELPTDEEMERDLAAMLPIEERVRRHMMTRAQGTLQMADSRIEALGIDLEAAERERQARLQLFPPLVDGGPQVALCGKWASETPLTVALRARLSSAPARWLDLEALGQLKPEEIKEQTAGCESIAICPGGESPEAAASGLAALLKGLPEKACRIVLLSSPKPEGAQEDGDDEVSDKEAGGGGGGGPGQLLDAIAAADAMLFGRRRPVPAPTLALENLLTVAARERGPLDAPLYLTILRATLGETQEAPAVTARLPATVREASWGLRTMLIGGVQGAVAATFGQAKDANPGGLASAGTVAATLAFALQRGVDVREFTVTGHNPNSTERDWEELMLPLVGPELWRLELEDPKRARAWVRGWVDFNYGRGASKVGPAMKKAGLKTPVEVRHTTTGVCIKYCPPGTRDPGSGFDGLLEGGLEILVDEEYEGQKGRLRVRRCSYGWNKKPREGSERAILSKLRRDWDMAQSFG